MRYGAAILLVICFSCLTASTLRAASLDAVALATNEMNDWLGEGPRADGWRRYLRIDQLTDQIEQGDQADPAQLLAVLSRFRRNAAGLELPQFVAVRDALEAWIEELGVSPPKLVADWLATSQWEFQPIDDEQLHAARAAAAEAARELDALLAQGSDENAQTWKTFLLWEDLQAQLAADAVVDMDALNRILSRYYSGHAGLEWTQFVRLRESLLRYRRLLVAQADSEMKAKFDEQLVALKNNLSDELSPTQVSAQLEWLEDLGQAKQIVARVQETFGSPNLYFSASSATIAKGLSNEVDQTSAVDELILGTRVRGTAHTVGNVTARLIPREDKAALEIALTGTSHTNTVGRQRPVSVYSRGVTQVAGRKQLIVDEDGIVGKPATANCNTATTISGIRTDGRFASGIIQRVAWNRVYEQKARAEYISSRRAERRVARMIDSRADQMIRDGNERIERELRRPLRRRNIYPRWVRFWSTGNRLFMRSLQGRRFQLAAASRPPAAPDHGVVIQVHESLFLNSATNGFGGFLLTDVRAQELVKELTDEVPPELEIRQDEDPWSITFDRSQPLTVKLNENQVVIAIRARRFTRAEEVVGQTMEIAATYDISAEDGRVKLVRQGDIRVTYPGKEGDRLSLMELRNKTFMTGKFEGLFKEEIRGEGLKLPERFKNLEDLVLEFASTTGGWLSLGWN